MALKLRHPGIEPAGEFDVLDTDAANIIGGDIGVFDGTLRDSAGGTDLHAYDVDGYVSGTNPFRTVVRLADNTDVGPFLLLDDGIAGYGTMFGSIIGSNAGQATSITGAVVVGPSTLRGSGKVTCWDKPGLYMVTIDTLGTTPPNSGTAPGTALYADANGLWTTVAGGAVVARFIEWQDGDSLVTTTAEMLNGTFTITDMVIAKV